MKQMILETNGVMDLHDDHPWISRWNTIVKDSGQIILFHQPRFAWNKGMSLSQLHFGVRSCEVARIWPEDWFKWFSFANRWLFQVPAVNFLGCIKVWTLQKRGWMTRFGIGSPNHQGLEIPWFFEDETNKTCSVLEFLLQQWDPLDELEDLIKLYKTSNWKQQGSLYYQPKQCTLVKEIPQKYHPFASSLIPPKMGPI